MHGQEPILSTVSPFDGRLKKCLSVSDLFFWSNLKFASLDCPQNNKMCWRVQCPKCNKPSWEGCGLHIESALKGVAIADRCKCKEVRAFVLSLFSVSSFLVCLLPKFYLLRFLFLISWKKSGVKQAMFTLPCKHCTEVMESPIQSRLAEVLFAAFFCIAVFSFVF